MKPEPSIAGIILSGGASRRMGTPKALLRFENETFLDRMIRLFADVCDPVIVVLGHNAGQIRSGIERASQAVFATNADPDRGMLSSLQCGLAEVPQSAEAVLFTPVDHPSLRSATIEKLAADFRTHRAPVTIPTYQSRHGHPVCIARPPIAELLALQATSQASEIIHRYRSETVYVDVDDPGVTIDVDDPKAYAELVARHP
ncbi:MAG TPA: nucleotidyltransferase family protein [Bryobacteraceae bacterium]|nr:nucleotidyltransferase family protein [Bryobacteraceae bacterium]